AHPINNADKINAFCGSCLLDKCPKILFHFALPSKVTEKSNRPARYKKMIVEETADNISKKTKIERAFIIQVAHKTVTNGLALVATFDHGITSKIPKIAMT